jgi:hypothetical protein
MYNYKIERENLFTDEGQRTFLQIRDRVVELLKKAGAVRMQEAWRGTSGDTWVMMACVDRMVELGELVEVTPPDTMGQFRIFTETPEKALRT